jgi:hypothetical protein
LEPQAYSSAASSSKFQAPKEDRQRNAASDQYRRVFGNKLRNLRKGAVFAVPSNSFVVGRLMLASSWNLEWGKRLRGERERLGLSLRDVKTLSHGIADKLQNSDYNIAHTSLAEIENGKWPPTFHGLYTLSVIYPATTFDWRACVMFPPAKR